MNNKKSKELRRALGLSGSKKNWTMEQRQMYNRAKGQYAEAKQSGESGQKLLDILASVSSLMSQGVNNS